MTRVCLVGKEDVHLQYELLSRETSREALAPYDLTEPYENTLSVETVSLGAAVSLLNDLQWYLVRFTADAIIKEPSVSDTEWLSRGLASAIRDGAVDSEETGRFLRVYGVTESESGAELETVEEPETGKSVDDTGGDSPADHGSGEETSHGRTDEARGEATGPPTLRDPMLVTRTGGAIPTYDLHDVSDTLVVRVTEDEFGA